jgi:D-arabinose 1-dehydrogenase-like Zn-dependent alcohol dehydrogenase
MTPDTAQPSDTSASRKTMRVAQVPKAGGAFELVERPIPEPPAAHVRIQVQACGVCHSDSLTKEGHMPGIQYPRVPGHEVIGLIDAVGADTTPWKVGQRVGLGWYGGHCGHCEPCRRGDLVMCRNASIPGITYDGGYAEYVIAPAEALALVPDSLDSTEAAPLLCAGITTFNAIRNSNAKAPDLVAILGIGGLGHLAVQYAAKLGFRTVAIARGADKAKFAKELGAHHYIDSTSEDVAKALQALGGAKLILSTVTSTDAIDAAIGGLAYAGELVVVGISMDPIKVTSLQLIGNRQSIHGWPSGTAIDSEDTLNFSELQNVKALIETFPLEKAAEAYDRMMSGKARFRAVLAVQVPAARADTLSA